MNGPQDDVRLPFSTVDPVMGDLFSVLWESKTLGQTGNALKILGSEVLSSVGQQVLQMTLLGAMMSALQWPIRKSRRFLEDSDHRTEFIRRLCSPYEAWLLNRQSLVECPRSRKTGRRSARRHPDRTQSGSSTSHTCWLLTRGASDLLYPRSAREEESLRCRAGCVPHGSYSHCFTEDMARSTRSRLWKNGQLLCKERLDSGLPLSSHDWRSEYSRWFETGRLRARPGKCRYHRLVSGPHELSNFDASDIERSWLQSDRRQVCHIYCHLQLSS